jgi:hypothetical protein
MDLTDTTIPNQCPSTYRVLRIFLFILTEANGKFMFMKICHNNNIKIVYFRCGF